MNYLIKSLINVPEANLRSHIHVFEMKINNGKPIVKYFEKVSMFQIYCQYH